MRGRCGGPYAPSPMRRALVLLAVVVVVVFAGAMTGGGGATSVAKVGPCVAAEEGRDYVPGPDLEEFQNGATGVTNAVAVRLSKQKSYTVAQFVGGEAEGKIGTWGVNDPSPGVAVGGYTAFGLDRNARRWAIAGVDTRLSIIARNFGLRASDPAAKKARKCIREAIGRQ
jgi:hypothetical protein